ncbi:hypothetical protein L1987_34510 [Smallanthus sonchifolius]|uniref:Uncharacterized protein n=1 Tax=Smallanthus sonchifolius TaxID=185202 RepID=A0ACB9HVQ5_9ASTR|nr:hypothetical protein L1987_34510 [Smallanthus sonchifolius]
MASFLQKLVRKQSPSTTLITNINKRILSSPTHFFDPKPDPPVATTPFFKTPDESNPHLHSPIFYPSFSFEAFLSPISHIQSVVPEEDTVRGDDERAIWADSVKKKRKKKMNKHKLKKLRKRLRRKT